MDSVQCKPLVKIVHHSADRSWCRFPYSFLLSREKWNFIKDEGGCCPFLEDIYSLIKPLINSYSTF